MTNAAADPDTIRAWQRLSPTLTTSGRLQPGDPARLAAAGVRHVINLALTDHPEALPDAEEEIAAAGIAYTHIPVPFDAPTDAHFDDFVTAMEASEGPVHVHCIMNWRVSAFCYRWHRDHAGMPEPEARALMAKHWDPATSEHPAAAPWADFIAAGAGKRD